MLQPILILVIFIAIIVPLGKYLYHITEGTPTFADPVFNPIDKVICKVCSIDNKAMNWKQYFLSMLATNGVMVVVGFVILKIQGLLFLNPNQAQSMTTDLSFNTIISFMTNTNLQHYAGETGLSYLSQMVVIIFLMFTSAATGIAVFMAFGRGLSGRFQNFGNYYSDMVRIITRVLLPISVVIAVVLISQGVPQNLMANITVTTIEGKLQDIAMGPMAALEAIKHLGTNGGGFMGANSASPLENPTPITNIVEMISMMILPGSCVIAFGHLVTDGIRKGQKTTEKKSLMMINPRSSLWDEGGRHQVKEGHFPGEARPLLAVMLILLIIGMSIVIYAETSGNPILGNLGVSQEMGNMEGKEVRNGVIQSSIFTSVTTSFTTGSVNNMHDSLTPLGGAVPLMNMMLNVVFGGDGVGLMNMVIYAILAVFICGLMIGRTPEYLGKKIEGKEMTLAAIGIIVHPLLILVFSALAIMSPAGLNGITNPGFHGLSQVLYEYASSAANNGSGFEGLADNNVFWNLTTGFVMVFGRYIAIGLQLAIAGSLMAKQPVNQSAGTLRTNTATFTVALLMIVVIIAALTFFPVMVLGPVAEHLTLFN